jgi:pilus assembly protein CpaB
MNRAALVASILAAVLGVALLILYKQRFEDETSGGRRVPVLMAIKDIPLGSVITEAMVGLRGLPEDYLEERHIPRSESRRVVGVQVNRTIRANESILWSDLAVTNDDNRTLAVMVPAGMRAVAVPSTLPSTFGGLLRPGDRVDALLTTQDRTIDTRIAIPLLQNLLVLSVGNDVGAEMVAGEDESVRKFRMTTVTVAATVQQAQALVFAIDQGEVTMTLRNPEDVAVLEGLPETTRSDLVEGAKREQFQKRQPKRAQGAQVPDVLH